MICLRRLTAAICLLLVTPLMGSPEDARRIQKSWDLAMEKWSLEMRVATTQQARAVAAGQRPDAVACARQMWAVIGRELDEEWTLEPAAWFLRAAQGAVTNQANGQPKATFDAEVEMVRKAVEQRHLQSPKLIPMCMALVSNPDPRSLSILETIQNGHPDSKIQGVAALGAAMVLKSIGDDAELMRKRLTYLRKAIIQSSDVDLGGTSVAKLAEDELYIIRFLTKGRVAPDLNGKDTAGQAFKLSDYQGKVVMLVFWSSTMQDAERVLQITSELKNRFEGKPMAVIGVNHDSLENLRAMEADGRADWKNFSDPEYQLARDYRVGSWPLVYVLDGERKIHYAGGQGSFVELTIDALLSENQPTTGK